MRCECDADDAEAVRFHGGSEEGCPREANADEVIGDGKTVSSPALCVACAFGCCRMSKLISEPTGWSRGRVLGGRGV